MALSPLHANWGTTYMLLAYILAFIYVYWPTPSSLEIKKQAQRIYKTLHQLARKSGIALQSRANA
jgi:hypothetical protein